MQRVTEKHDLLEIWARVVQPGHGPKQNPSEGSLGREHLTVSVRLVVFHLQVEVHLICSWSQWVVLKD